MKTRFAYVSLGLGLGLVGCSGSGGDLDAGPIYNYDTAPAALDTAPTPIDTAPPDPYLWVVIQDTEQIACTTNGPGSDIDAVALLSAAGAVLGYGKVPSARFTPNGAGNACANADCSGGDCKYAYIGTTFPPETLVSYTEGPPNAVVQPVGNDYGYFSLNAGTLQIQIGDNLTGAGPAQAIQPLQYIQVFEVDKSYVVSGSAPASCSCLPEHYTVSLQSAGGKLLALTPVRLDPSNTTCAPLTLASTAGCGTTMFAVP